MLAPPSCPKASTELTLNPALDGTGRSNGRFVVVTSAVCLIGLLVGPDERLRAFRDRLLI